MQNAGVSLDDINHYFNTEEIDNPFENKVVIANISQKNIHRL